MCHAGKKCRRHFDLQVFVDEQWWFPKWGTPIAEWSMENPIEWMMTPNFGGRSKPKKNVDLSEGNDV
jgi:hypothetical protein